MTDVWSARARLYEQSEAHRRGDDLEQLVAWSRGARTALDVATGGGHVARRLREAGLTVVTCDAAPGMAPDVVCPADDIPFADASFDVVTCRTAAHHFPAVGAAVREMARVAAEQVLVADTLFMGEGAEEAERLRDPSHVRNYSEDEWRRLFANARLAVAEVVVLEHAIDFDSWLARTDCRPPVADRVRELWGKRVADGRLTLDKIALRGRKD